MPDIKILNPDSLGKPLGQYSQITRVKASEFLFIAGQVGADKDGKHPAPISTPMRADLRQHRRGAGLAGRLASPTSSSSPPTSCIRRTFLNSWPTAPANFPSCSRAAPTRPTRC